MRYRLLAIVVIGCASSATSNAPTASSRPAPTAPSTNGAIDLEMVASIDGFLAAPTQDAAAPILSRIANDDGVTVTIPGQLMALLTGPGIDEPTTGLLLTGFTAGAARPQYATGVKRDDFVAGLRGLLAVSRALGVTSAQLDEAAASDQAGTLEGWAHDWLAAHPSGRE